MQSALRLCLRISVILGLFGGVVVARPRTLLPAAHASGEALAVTVVWFVVGICIAWLTLVSLIYVATVRTRHEYVARTCLRVMPRFVWHLLEIALVTSAATGPAMPAMAAPNGSTPAVRRDVPVVRTMAPSAPQTERSQPPSFRSATPRHEAQSMERTHVVQPGDNLWRIAREELTARHGGVPPDEISTGRYWQQVIAANRGTLRSGDPSLIYAGELVALPPAD
jgi:hypothetical protein